ncbi:variable surface protein Vir21, putative [Plasmodium vivax]|uniref:Variable surface protein Vir21, putative n=1 Tax=Plasmodium vivax (strain Salvador I) TaxID=126793 RepID=A5KCV2_PLAVS|nr:variable surface protein Vir21, putative [Plasmodium vivax]EDL42820.1 variable surface protein Vir21, putative [Plasmodium vivax]|eukprot:XP_001612607.1 variable surface protein Vir21 [Plasmodium vivax Sal-1]
MNTSEKDFSVDKIKEEYKFIEDSNFYKIYNELNWDCNSVNYNDSGSSCFKGTLDKWTNFTDVNDLLKELYSTVYRIYIAIIGNNNDYFDKHQSELKKIGYIYLKYWLYDKIMKANFDDSKIEKLFQGWNNFVEREIKRKPNNLCIFYSLKKDEIKKFQKIYAFNTILYASDKKSSITCGNNQCKYMDYFEEALTEFINSIKKFSSVSSNNEYCKEFNEFLNVCKDENPYAGISINYEYKSYSSDHSKKYLSVEEYKENPLYIYIKNNEWIKFDKIAHLLNTQNSTTIAATSVVGSAIELSSIFYYFFKFTPFGSSLRTGKGKNIVNIDQEAHDALLYTSDAEQTPFQSRKYNVAYHNFSDT